MRKLYLFIFVLFSSFYVNADSLHLIVVGDTNSDIEHQVLKDVQFIYSRGASLASELDFDYRPTILTGKLATKRSVLSFMDAKIIHPEDMVIFYFTGHGFRTRDKRTPWPNLHFQEADEWLGLEEIVERLFQVNPRFSLVIADCCNNYPTQEMPEKCSFHFPIASHHDFHPKVSELFKNSQGILVISGAEPGGFSWSTDEGGILTAAFFEALGFRQKQIINWNQVIENVKNRTSHIQKVQMAYLPARNRRQGT